MSNRLHHLLLNLSLILVSCLIGFAQPDDELDPVLEQVLSLSSVGGVAISPDGSEVAYTISARDGKGNGLGTEIRVVSTSDGEDRLLTQGGAPAWSPDGSHIAYFSSLSGSRQIWTIPAKGGKPRQLTNYEGFIDRFRWAPNSKHIAMLVRRSHEADLRFFTQASHPRMPIVVDSNNLPMNQLAIVDLENGTTNTITPRDYSVGGYEQWFPDTFSWSPDSKRIVITKRPHAKAGSHLFGDLITITRDGRALRPLVESEGMDGYPVWSPDGSQVAYISTERYDWVTVSYLYVVDPRTLERRKITPDYDEKIKSFYWTADSKRILFIGGDRVATQIYSVDVAGAEVHALTEGNDVYGGLSVAGKSDSIAYIRQNAEQAPDVYFANLVDMKPKRLTEVNPQVKTWPQVRTEVVRWKSFDGMEIEGLVHWPINYREGQSYPLLVIPHGGPHAVMSNTFVNSETRIFAHRGWVVFRPNFRGSGHYGEKFLRANLGSWGIGDFQDVMSGVDHLIDIGLVDPDKLGISGASYGGYMSSWTISQTDRFKAAVIGAPITDVPSFLRTTDVPERFESYLGKDIHVYQRSSPMTYADNMKTPSLLWHGDADIRVPLMQSRHLYTALLKNQVPVEYVIYPDEPHGLQRALNRRDLMLRRIRWLHSWVIDGRHPELFPPEQPK